MEQLKGVLKTVVTTIVAIALVYLLVKLVIWNLYKTDICEPLYNDAENAGMTLVGETSKYLKTIDNKYEVSLDGPSGYLKFDAFIQVNERSAAFWKNGGGDKQIIVTYSIYPNYKGDFEYVVSFDEITSSTGATMFSLGSFIINPSSLEIVEDNTNEGNGAEYLSTYKIRIQKLIEIANTNFGSDIQ